MKGAVPSTKRWSVLGLLPSGALEPGPARETTGLVPDSLMDVFTRSDSAIQTEGVADLQPAADAGDYYARPTAASSVWCPLLTPDSRVSAVELPGRYQEL